MGQLYWVVATESYDDDPELEEVVFGPEVVWAKDSDDALVKGGRLTSGSPAAKVVVRPF